jgi:BirA family biotin operon repressor/biotin-[acetyl-CoA-carboxylase] ligase
VSARATSLEGELGRAVDRGTVLCECLAAFETRYAGLRAGTVAAVLDEWRALAQSTLQRPVEWDTASGTRHGIAEDVDDSGALIVRTAAGRERLIAGEVRWI